MQRSLHYGVIALAMLAAPTIAFAQQNKTFQNSADEALVKSAPEAKDPPQAPPQAAPTPQASQPGLNAMDPVLLNGRLTAAGALQDSQTVPAKFSEVNDKIDQIPIMAYPAPLTDDQRQAIYQRVTQGQGPVVSLDVDLKPAQVLPASVEPQAWPSDVAEKYPSVADYKYVRLQDKILLVNPREGIVVGEIKG